MPDIIKVTGMYLFEPSQNHDKVWAGVILAQNTGGFHIATVWGRRGNKLHVAQPTNVTFRSLALELLRRTVTQKEREGYELIDWMNPAYGLEPVITKLGVYTQASGTPVHGTLVSPAPQPACAFCVQKSVTHSMNRLCVCGHEMRIHIFTDEHQHRCARTQTSGCPCTGYTYAGPGVPVNAKQVLEHIDTPALPKPVEQPRRAPRSIIHLLPDDL